MAIHPGTGWYGPGRRWPADRFAEAATLILGRTDLACVIVGTAQDRKAAQQVTERLGPHAASLVGRTSLGVLAALLERSELLVANDGGVAHLAAAVGTPVVTIFGPSNDRAWRQLTGKVVAVDLPCRPCFYRDFQTGLVNGCATRECMTLLPSSAVAETALQLLGKKLVV
jgi:ADP-heptose:LPS heptosyltransferase